MTALAEEGVTAEETTQDVKVEEVTTEAVEETDDSKDESPEVEEVVETVDEKVDRLERDVAGKQKAIDRKTASHHAQQRKIDEQKMELQKLAQSIEEKKPQVEPSIDDYETHDEYNDAVKDFIKKTAKAEAQSEMLAEQRQIQQEQIVAGRTKLRQEQEVEYMADNPKYKMASNEVESYINGLVDVGYEVMEAVASQLYDGNVPAVIDYFGSNDGEHLVELGDISRMSPPRAAVEIYKIQQKLLASPTKKETKPKTTPVKTEKGSTKSAKPLSKQSGKDVLDWVKS